MQLLNGVMGKTPSKIKGSFMSKGIDPKEKNSLSVLSEQTKKNIQGSISNQKQLNEISKNKRDKDHQKTIDSLRMSKPYIGSKNLGDIKQLNPGQTGTGKPPIEKHDIVQDALGIATGGLTDIFRKDGELRARTLQKVLPEGAHEISKLVQDQKWHSTMNKAQKELEKLGGKYVTNPNGSGYVEAPNTPEVRKFMDDFVKLEAADAGKREDILEGISKKWGMTKKVLGVVANLLLPSKLQDLDYSLQAYIEQETEKGRDPDAKGKGIKRGREGFFPSKKVY